MLSTVWWCLAVHGSDDGCLCCARLVWKFDWQSPAHISHRSVLCISCLSTSFHSRASLRFVFLEWPIYTLCPVTNGSHRHCAIKMSYCTTKTLICSWFFPFSKDSASSLALESRKLLAVDRHLSNYIYLVVNVRMQPHFFFTALLRLGETEMLSITKH